jgi:hypothetical protein
MGLIETGVTLLGAAQAMPIMLACHRISPPVGGFY